MPHSPLYRALLAASILLLPAAPLCLHSQTAVPDEHGNLVFRTNARTVVLDVVVTGKNGQPVPGMHKQDFQVLEDGRPQTLTYFEEHTAQTAPTNLPPLPPNVFTNIPRITPTDSVTVLLLDSLNTQLQDQNRVHQQMLKYLKALPPGRRIAIFALGNRLTFIQGFTEDSALLAQALNDPKNGSGPITSPLLKTQGEVAAENQPLALIASSANVNPAAASTLLALQQFMAEQTAGQADLRVKGTFQAFQELANYLAGVPGRKNVIWFSSAFPLTLFPDPSLSDSFATERDYADEVRKTDALLSSAQVSIYPVAAEGLATDSLFDIEQRSGAVATGQSSAAQPNIMAAGGTQGQQQQQEQSASLQGDALSRNGAHNAMEEIARDTGGEAFFNTNGLSDAIARASDHGAAYYSMTYTPANAVENGAFRKIQVKLPGKISTNISSGGLKLAYRRGYYAATPASESAAVKASADPLHPFMGPGMPASTQIPFALRVLPGRDYLSTAPGAPNERAAANPLDKPSGDNPDVTKAPGPFTRYRVDFVIAASGLHLEQVATGRHGGIEVTLLAYSQDGRPLNWLVRQVNLDMDAARFAKVEENGVSVTFTLDVPQSGVFLRAGVYDQLSHLAGTVEVPFSSVHPVQVSTTR